MARVTRGFKARRRRNKVLKLAKGFRGGRHRLYRSATEAVDRALNYAYRDRRNKKRDFRSLWIARISAAAKQNGTSYSRLMGGLKKAGVELDLKMAVQ
jgi:large subunit ribosomal protein L20